MFTSGLGMRKHVLLNSKAALETPQTTTLTNMETYRFGYTVQEKCLRTILTVNLHFSWKTAVGSACRQQPGGVLQYKHVTYSIYNLRLSSKRTRNPHLYALYMLTFTKDTESLLDHLNVHLYVP